MANEKKQKVNIEKIRDVRASIEAQLEASIAEDGTIDLIKLREDNKSLAEIFDVITLSKTWRDDPKAFAKDVARMISARDSSSVLGSALDKLESKLVGKVEKQ